jgi:hypothetical protein
MSDSNIVDVIDRAIGLAPAKLLEVGGFTFIDKDKTATMFMPPKFSSLEVSRLTGLVDLLENGFESVLAENPFVHVISHEQVDVICNTSDGFGRRQRFISAKLQKPEREFTFNQYMGQEQFIIALRSLFIQDSQLDDLVRLAGNLASGSEIRQEDDGFTQRATVKAGVVMVQEKTILPRVTLTPFRTFREAKQPSSEYVFRVKGDEKGNYCALFEADGGTWKLQAMDNVKDWISNQIKGSDVEGLSDIRVIA